METVAILVSAVLTIFALFIRHFLEKSRAEQKEKSSRRANIYDKRIKDAKHYLETWDDIFVIMRKYSLVFTAHAFAHDENLAFLGRAYDDLSLVNKNLINSETIDILEDSKLEKLHKDFMLQIHPALSTFKDVITLLEEDKEDFFMGHIEPEKLLVPVEVSKLISKMKIRLDELAENIP